MCGVLGITGLTTLGQGKILLQMLTHRGQDASGLAWIEGKNKDILISKKDSYPDLLDVDDEKQKDKYGRTLAVVYVAGMNLNQQLLKKGYAEIMYIPPSEFNPYAW